MSLFIATDALVPRHCPYLSSLFIQHYTIGNERCGTKQSLHHHHKTELQLWGLPDSIIFNIWIDFNIAYNEKCVKYLVAIVKVNEAGFHGPVNFLICLFFP
jgi:hypothetical protein